MYWLFAFVLNLPTTCTCRQARIHGCGGGGRRARHLNRRVGIIYFCKWDTIFSLNEYCHLPGKKTWSDAHTFMKSGFPNLFPYIHQLKPFQWNHHQEVFYILQLSKLIFFINWTNFCLCLQLAPTWWAYNDMFIELKTEKFNHWFENIRINSIFSHFQVPWVTVSWSPCLLWSVTVTRSLVIGLDWPGYS